MPWVLCDLRALWNAGGAGQATPEGGQGSPLGTLQCTRALWEPQDLARVCVGGKGKRIQLKNLQLEKQMLVGSYTPPPPQAFFPSPRSPGLHLSLSRIYPQAMAWGVGGSVLDPKCCPSCGGGCCHPSRFPGAWVSHSPKPYPPDCTAADLEPTQPGLCLSLSPLD